MYTGETYGMQNKTQRRPSADQHKVREEELRLSLGKEEKTSTG